MDNNFFGFMATRQDMLDAAVGAILSLPDPTDAYEVEAALRSVGLYEISSHEAEYIENEVNDRL